MIEEQWNKEVSALYVRNWFCQRLFAVHGTSNNSWSSYGKQKRRSKQPRMSRFRRSWRVRTRKPWDTIAKKVLVHARPSSNEISTTAFLELCDRCEAQEHRLVLPVDDAWFGRNSQSVCG